jgi:hypothetical protein
MARYTQDTTTQPDDYQAMVNQNVIDQGTGGTGPGPGGAGAWWGRTTDLPTTTDSGYTYSGIGSRQPPVGNDLGGQEGNPSRPNPIDTALANAPPPAPSPGTAAPPAPAAPPAVAAAAPAAGPIAAPTGSSTLNLPPELTSILSQLAQGFQNFRAPTINYQPQTTPAYDEAVRGAIMSALEEGQRPVNPTDPLVAPMLATMQGQAQRAKDYNSQQLAERLSAQNLLHSGAYDVGQAGYNQNIDEALSGQTAQLMTQVLTDRRNRLMQALQLGANYLNADQARQLQAELGNVNSALQSYGVKANVGLGLLESLLQNQRFYDQLGLNAGEFQAGLNAGAVPQLPQGISF